MMETKRRRLGSASGCLTSGDDLWNQPGVSEKHAHDLMVLDCFYGLNLAEFKSHWIISMN